MIIDIPLPKELKKAIEEYLSTYIPESKNSVNSIKWESLGIFTKTGKVYIKNPVMEIEEGGFDFPFIG